jgi:excisionase family DNA binding protein
MDGLLTVNQVRSLLKVDRLTVYRMLKDGRLNGVKIGHEWRFSRHEVDSFLAGLGFSPASLVPDETPQFRPIAQPKQLAQNDLPMHCVELIQQVFADVAEVGVVTLSPDGEPLDEISNPCKFCRLILSSPSGRRACAESWQKMSPRASGGFATCHAGLQYATTPIELEGTPVAQLAAGQFYAKASFPDEETTRIERLAEKHGLDHTTLKRAAAEIHRLDEREKYKMQRWLKSVALTISSMGHERAELVGRLRSIAAMTALGRPSSSE